MPLDARAFWIAEPGRGEIRPERIDEIDANDLPRNGYVQVRAEFSGISRGTEALVFQGRVPPTEYARMRAPFQQGDFPAPVKYGYASVGTVERGPSGLEGRRVFALHPHQTRYVLPHDAIHPIPDAVPSGRAVLAANLETAINGVWDANIRPGDRVVVVGAGTVGCLVAWLAGRIPGCSVRLVDVNATRRAIATALGVGFAAPDELNPVNPVNPVNPASADADVVVHASGSPAGLQTALAAAAFEATIVEMSWYGDAVVPLRLGEAFHARRLTIRSSQVGHVAAAQRARWDTKRRLQLALSLLDDPALDVLITGESAFDELPSVMARLSTDPADTLCHRIRYV